MKKATECPTPQYVIDAIDTVAAWLREIEAAEAIISPHDGAAFHAERQADRLLAGWERAMRWATAWKAAAKGWRAAVVCDIDYSDDEPSVAESA